MKIDLLQKLRCKISMKLWLEVARDEKLMAPSFRWNVMNRSSFRKFNITKIIKYENWDFENHMPMNVLNRCRQLQHASVVWLTNCHGNTWYGRLGLLSYFSWLNICTTKQVCLVVKSMTFPRCRAWPARSFELLSFVWTFAQQNTHSLHEK